MALSPESRAAAALTHAEQAAADAGSQYLGGGTTLTDYAVPERRRIPLFVREGAIVPVDVESETTGLGNEASADHLTVLVWPSETPRPRPWPPHTG